MSSDWQMIVFDMDGVLVDVESSWAWVHDHFGVDNENSLKAYLRGNIDDDEFIKRDIDLWRSVKPDLSKRDITNLLKDVPLMKGFHETVPVLSDSYTTGVISGGLKPLAESIGGRYFDRILANDIEERKGRLTGRGIVEVGLNAKGRAFEKLTSRLGIQEERCIAVGNSHFDAPMLEKAGFGIAFNPSDNNVRKAADFVIEEKDLSLLPKRADL